MDHHHHEPFSSLFCMSLKIYDMVKDFLCTITYIAVHFFELSLELGELEVPSTKI